jgi:hypothetical protein
MTGELSALLAGVVDALGGVPDSKAGGAAPLAKAA